MAWITPLPELLQLDQLIKYEIVLLDHYGAVEQRKSER